MMSHGSCSDSYTTLEVGILREAINRPPRLNQNPVDKP